MRGPTWLLLLVACGGTSRSAAVPPPPAPPPPPVASCDEVATRLIDALTGALEPRPPADQIDRFVGLLRERCAQDGWSEEARACLVRVRSRQDAGPCAALLTEAQQAALDVPEGGAPEQAPVPPAPVGGTRAPVDEGTGVLEDACAGGE